MFSRMSSKVGRLVVVLFLLSGCGLEIGESPAPAGEVKLEGYSCVNQISLKVGEYFDGELSDNEVIEFVDCLKKSVSDFAKRMKRRPGTDVYNPEDLRIFINRISKERELNERLLNEFMKIKQTFVGGRADQISRRDLAAALNLLEDIKKAALVLRPHVQIFNSNLGANIPPERIALELDRSSEAMNEVLRIFISSLRETENTYSLKDFGNFLEEFRNFINWYGVFPDGRPAKDWVELVASLKEISTGGDRYLIQKDEWESFLSFSQSAYIAFLKIKYGVSGQDLWQGIGLKNLVHVVDQVRDEVIRLISSRKNRLIPKEEVFRLLKSLERMDWLPLGLSASIWSEALELFVTKILEEGSKGEFVGFRISHLLRVAGEFENWASTQKYISTHVVQGREQGKITPQVFTNDEEEVEMTQDFVPLGWIEFKRFIDQRRPLFTPDSRFVSLTYATNLPKYGVRYDLHNLSLTHLFYRALNMVYQAYGVRGPMGDFLLSGGRLQDFYTDFFDFGVALNWLDSRSKTAGSRSYIEGNLFTYAADGLNGEFDLTLSEGVDLIAYLLTGGQLTDRLYMNFDFCPKGPKDFRGMEKLLRACVEKNLAQALIDELGFAPELQNWLSDQDKSVQRTYTDLLLRSAYSQRNSDPDWVEKSELSTLSVVILYSESVLTRFDADYDGTLSDPEVDVAFPIFKEFINVLAKNLLQQEEDLSENRIQAIYEFILYNKRAPETRTDMVSIWWNSKAEPNWVIDSDRMALTEAFSVIINRLLNGASPPEK